MYVGGKVDLVIGIDDGQIGCRADLDYSDQAYSNFNDIDRIYKI